MNVPDETPPDETSLVKARGPSFVPSMTCSRPELPAQKLQPLYSVPSVSLLRFLCLAVLKSFTLSSDNDLMLFFNSLHTKNAVSLGATMRQRCLIIMLLIICGDVQPNPGPVDIDSKICNTPADFKNRSGLGIIHLNMRSMLPKIDSLRIWAKSTDVDIIILS